MFSLCFLFVVFNYIFNDVRIRRYEFGSKLHFGKMRYQNSNVSRFQERVNPRDVKAALIAFINVVARPKAKQPDPNKHVRFIHKIYGNCRD